LEQEVRLFTHAWDRDPTGPWVGKILPFISLFVPVPSALRLEIARRHAGSITRQAASQPPLSRPPRGDRSKLRIGYASADFHDHATAQLATGLFEAHDRNHFE